MFSQNTKIDSSLSEPQIISPSSIQPIPQLQPAASPTSIVPLLNTFVKRAKWSSTILLLAKKLFERIETNIVEINTVKHAVSVSLTHLTLHSNGILKSIANVNDFAVNLNENAESGSDWQQALEIAEKIPVHKAFLSGHNNNTLLSDWINKKEIESTSKAFQDQRSQIATKLDQINEKSEEMLNKMENLEQHVKDWFDASTTPVTSDTELTQVLAGHALETECNWKAYNDIYEDIATLVQKIQADCNYVATLSDTPKNVQNVSRILQLHERDFLTQALDLTKELYQIHVCWAKSKAYDTLKSISFLRVVSSIQFFSSPLRNEVNDLSNSLKSAESNRVVIARAIDMPYLYGALLFELIRRDEWISKMKSHVGQTAELLATWRDSEIRRRTKWIRHLGGSLGMLKRIGGGGTTGGTSSSSNSPTRGSSPLSLTENSNVPDVEITIVNNKDSLEFNLTRQDISNYLDFLKRLGLVEEQEELEKLITKTDKMDFFPKPLSPEDEQQQAGLRRKSLFKEGNISEYSKSLLLGKSVSSSKVALTQKSNSNNNNGNKKETGDVSQAKIQAYEARIRKLEDLLHRTQFRESWTNRIINSGANNSQRSLQPTNGFELAANNKKTAVASNLPTTDASTNKITETQSDTFTKEESDSLLAKIEKLETELASQKNSLQFAQDTHSKLHEELDTHKIDLAEAQMMKSDLMANLSTKEGEFAAERRLLREEIDLLKAKIDDLEIDLEREAENSVLAEEQLSQFQHWKAKAQETIKSQQLERQKFIHYKTESRKYYKNLLKKERKKTRAQEKKSLNYQMKYDVLYARAKDLSQRLFTSTIRSSDLLECLGLQVQKVFDDDDGELISFKIQRVKGLGRRARNALSAQGNAAIEASATIGREGNSNNGVLSPTSDVENSTVNASMALGSLITVPKSGIMSGPQQDLMKTINIDPSVFYWMDPRGSSDEDSENSEGDDELSDTDGEFDDFEEYEEDGTDSGSIDDVEAVKDTNEKTINISKGSIETESLIASPSDANQINTVEASQNDKPEEPNPVSATSSTSVTSSVSKTSTTSTISYEQRKQRKREQMISSGVLKAYSDTQKFSFIDDIPATPKEERNPTKRIVISENKVEERVKEKKAENQKLLERYRRRASTRIETRYHRFLNCVYMDYDIFRDSVRKRFLDVEQLARKLQREVRGYRERAHYHEILSRSKIAFQNFKPGDLALFLPTRDQNREPNPWAAFNIGAPHFFLKQKKEFQLEEREWLVARITKIEERVVDRTKVTDASSSSSSVVATGSPKGKTGDKSESDSPEYNDNPFDLSDGLRWHLLEAVEERFSS